MQYLEIGVRCLIGTVFLASCASKLIRRTAYRDFVASIVGMRLLRPGHVRGVAAAVVSGEVVVCVLMVIPGPASHRIGFVLAGTLLLAFSAAILTVVRRRVTATCRCFGPSTVPLGGRHLARNAVLAISAGLGCAATFQDGPMDMGALVVAAFAGLVLGVLVVFLDDISELFAPSEITQARRLG
jgi:hypothetical protein